MAAAVVVALGALVAGTLLMRSRGADGPAGAQADTGNEVLDGVIDDLLRGDASTLSARFGTISAREGSIIGGPIGIASQRPVGAATWTAQLAASPARRLHGVVQAPNEPYPWTQSNAPPMPRASLFDGARDFDIVLVVSDSAGVEHPWRFSIAGDLLVDVIIDSDDGKTGAPLSVILKLAQLTPPPETDPGAFVILPPEEEWLPPRVPGSGLAPAPKAAGTMQPSFAPDGRSGDPEVDGIIEALLHNDAIQLGQRFPIAGGEETCTQILGQCSVDQSREPNASWTARLAGSKRSLYTVVTGNSTDVEVYLAVDEGTSNRASAWVFGIQSGRLVTLAIRLSQDAPAQAQPDRTYLSALAAYAPSPAREYQRFYVLPPRDELPRPPAAQPLSVRTGDAGVDRLLALIEQKNGAGLTTLLPAPGQVLYRECQGEDRALDAKGVALRLGELLPSVAGVHGVALMPQGYEPAAEHLLLFVVQTAPYCWQTLGVFEKDGRLLGLIDGDCQPQALYPPAGYLVPPPVGGLAGLDAARRSGIPVIDAILDAAAASDATRMSGLIAYRPVPCSDPGQIGTLPCPPGVANGTPIDAISISSCEGGYATREEAPQALIEIARRPLYAVVEAGTPSNPGVPAPDSSVGLLLLASPDRGAIALSVGPSGVTSVRSGCFVKQPERLIGTSTPDFLLPPP
jgi:hypothetical protein